MKGWWMKTLLLVSASSHFISLWIPSRLLDWWNFCATINLFLSRVLLIFLIALYKFKKEGKCIPVFKGRVASSVNESQNEPQIWLSDRETTRRLQHWQSDTFPPVSLSLSLVRDTPMSTASSWPCISHSDITARELCWVRHKKLGETGTILMNTNSCSAAQWCRFLQQPLVLLYCFCIICLHCQMGQEDQIRFM